MSPYNTLSLPSAVSGQRRVSKCALLVASTALGAISLATPPAFAVCDIHNPTSGQTVICNTTAPNPDATPVEAVAGSASVTVNVLAGAAISITNNNGIFVRDQSSVTNAGAITITGNTFDGVRFDSNNTITNSGTITTNGVQSEGMFSDGGDNNIVLNTGTIITNGDDSSGILVFTGSTGNIITNEGTITTIGDGAVGMQAVGDNNTFTNSGMITTSGSNANGILATGGNNMLTNSGDISVSGDNAHGIDWLGTTLGTVTNTGTISASGSGGLGAFFGAAATFTNTSTGSVVSQQANGIIANGGVTIDNAGTISGQQVGVVSANGPTAVTNSGAITGITAQGVSFQGDFNDSLTNTGTITGAGTAVAMDGGNDALTMNGGTVNGAIDQGDDNDTFTIDTGTVTGNVQQGNGNDDFRMTGGTIQSLSQGDNLDTFFMSDGHIVDFFEDGDRAIMTGGRIGRVDMKLDDNLFDMSGGTIDRNLVTGFGNDTIILSGGLIGGNISVSGGTDSMTITGGEVGGNVTLSTGNDTFLWQDGGIVRGTVDLGPDNDTAIFRNLSDANLGSTVSIDGNAGTDSLTLDNGSMSGVARLSRWESIAATNGTELTFGGTLALGDDLTGTGSLTIDETSTIFGGAADGAIAPFTAGQLANVVNSGRIDLTNGGSAPGDTFTITGNYTGNSGLLFLDTELGDDSSPSDRLVISAGTADGFTSLGIVNAGGTGGATTGNGILVVETAAGATTASGAFALTDPVAAGAFEYLLFKGGISAGTAENWYLRSTLVPVPPVSVPPEPAPLPPGAISPPIEPDQTPPNSEATPVVADVIPLYRVETPTYSVVPPVAQTIGLATLGTFHERRGDQSLLQTTGMLPAAWARIYGQDGDIKWSGTVLPTFDGSLAGIQAGLDVIGFESFAGHVDRAGLFVARTSASGDVRGQALGWNDLAVGDIDLDGTSFGGYWTHVGPQGWYLDAVLMGTWFDGNATSTRATGIDLDGSGITASLEGGYPIPLIENLTLEPQVQLVWQRFDFDDTADEFSTVSFDEDGSLYGRIGFRLQTVLSVSGATFRPYAKANLWHGFSGSQDVILGADTISTESDWTAFEIGGGLVAEINKSFAFHLAGDYTTNVSGEKQSMWEGNIGLTITW